MVVVSKDIRRCKFLGSVTEILPTAPFRAELTVDSSASKVKSNPTLVEQDPA